MPKEIKAVFIFDPDPVGAEPEVRVTLKVSQVRLLMETLDAVLVEKEQQEDDSYKPYIDVYVALEHSISTTHKS